MSMKRIFFVLVMLLFLLVLCACTNAAEDTVQPTDGLITYQLRVVDEAGKPMSGVMVQLCENSCYPATTDQNGIAEFHLAEADYKASVTVMPEGYSSEAEEFRFTAGSYELTISLMPISQGIPIS